MRPDLAGIAVALVITFGGHAALAAEQPADVCLEVAPGSLSAAEWEAVSIAVSEAVAERTALFPSPTVGQEPSRLDVDSGHAGQVRDPDGCLEAGTEWSARFGRHFLEAGADQMLAEAPTTPGIDSEVTIEWYPDEARLRTTLEFAGPLDIPNGTCWIDDALSVDAAAGVAATTGDQGVKTSLFAEGACDRFFDHLPDGGAGEQAVTLLPVAVALADGSELRFVVEDVRVETDAVSVAGSLERD